VTTQTEPPRVERPEETTPPEPVERLGIFLLRVLGAVAIPIGAFAVLWFTFDLLRDENASRIVVSGHSAGGHLAAMLLATPASAWGVGRHPVAGAVSLSGVHDLRPLVLFAFNVDFRLDDAEAARQSPILARPATDAPIVVAVGADETSEFVRQAQLLWDAWPANRPQGAAGPMLIPQRNHFSLVTDYADAQSALTQATLALF